VLRKGLGHTRAVLGAGTRHGHQDFHGHMSRERTAADLLLHAFWEQFHQRQAIRYPTHAAIESARQFLQAVAEALLEFGQ
jgi:predicted Zn-dependent protease